jgi:hypothetical protein
MTKPFLPKSETKFTPEYLAYLASKQWRDKRQAYFTLRGECCQVCGATEHVEVDHLDYTRFGGKELMSDLLGLCHAHHVEITEARREAGIRSGVGYRKFTARYFNIELPEQTFDVQVVPPKQRSKTRQPRQRRNNAKADWYAWTNGEQLGKARRRAALAWRAKYEAQQRWRAAKADHAAGQAKPP